MFSHFRTIVLASSMAACLWAQLPPEATAKIDAAAEKALADTGAPSVSVAVVKDGRIAYVNAYGKARLDPATPARPEMRYSIGSVSKQFMAAAILMLAEEGKLSLDDHVSRFLPNLTRANQITIRELLTHTSGYQDYYPLDYVAPFMQKPVTADEILKQWAAKPLDFDPGTRWQYSNTNYVVAGRILEKVTGKPFCQFLQARIFGPLSMTSVIDLDEKPLGDSDAAGYTRFGLGPARPATSEGRGWLFAAGELAMTAQDSGALGHFVDRAQTADPQIARSNDDSGSPEEWRTDRLCAGRRRVGCERPSDAAAWRRGGGLCQPEYRLAGFQSGIGDARQYGWIDGAGSHRAGNRAAAGRRNGRSTGRRGAGAGAVHLHWLTAGQDRSRGAQPGCRCLFHRAGIAGCGGQPGALGRSAELHADFRGTARRNDISPFF